MTVRTDLRRCLLAQAPWQAPWTGVSLGSRSLERVHTPYCVDSQPSGRARDVKQLHLRPGEASVADRQSVGISPHWDSAVCEVVMDILAKGT
jgi:hypothetical protein